MTIDPHFGFDSDEFAILHKTMQLCEQFDIHPMDVRIILPRSLDGEVLYWEMASRSDTPPEQQERLHGLHEVLGIHKRRDDADIGSILVTDDQYTQQMSDAVPDLKALYNKLNNALAKAPALHQSSVSTEQDTTPPPEAGTSHLEALRQHLKPNWQQQEQHRQQTNAETSGHDR